MTSTKRHTRGPIASAVLACRQTSATAGQMDTSTLTWLVEPLAMGPGEVQTGKPSTRIVASMRSAAAIQLTSAVPLPEREVTSKSSMTWAEKVAVSVPEPK